MILFDKKNNLIYLFLMSNLNLDFLEIQKINLADKIEDYFESIDEFLSFNFQLIKSSSKDKIITKEIYLSIYIKYDNSMYIWTKNGVTNFSNDYSEQNTLLKQLSKFNSNINYYLEHKDKHIYFDELYNNLVSQYDISVFEKEHSKFSRDNLNHDINKFIGQKTLSKIDSIKLNSLLKHNPIKDSFLKI